MLQDLWAWSSDKKSVLFQDWQQATEWDSLRWASKASFFTTMLCYELQSKERYNFTLELASECIAFFVNVHIVNDYFSLSSFLRTFWEV